MDVAERIIADAKARLDGGFAAAAGIMSGRLSQVLSVQAPLVPGVLPPRAATRAEPGAVPRRVSGYLQSKTGFNQLGPGRWVFGVESGPSYSRVLEFEIAHPFFGITVDAMIPEIVAEVSGRLRGGA